MVGGRKIWRLAGFVALAAAAGSRYAHAGIADAPLPRFADGKPSMLVLIVPGVVKRARLQTDFLCTSIDSVPVNIGVEVFDTGGTRLNDVGTGAGAILNVAGGQTVTIGTSGTKAFLESITIPLGGVAQGSARVVASSDRVRCNVVIADDAVTPPVTLATLGEGVRPAPGPGLPTKPLPRFADGQAATHAALIPGVVKRGRAQTDLFCTSLATGNVDIGVEILAPDGTVQNDIGAGNGAALSVVPGATVSFGTTGTMAFLESSVIVTPGVAQGAARVVSTSADIACAAFAVDSGAAPPVSMSALGAGAAY